MNVLSRTRLFAVPLPCCTTCRTNTTHQHPSTAKPKALKLQTRRDLDATRLHIPEWIKLFCHHISLAEPRKAACAASASKTRIVCPVSCCRRGTFRIRHPPTGLLMAFDVIKTCLAHPSTTAAESVANSARI